MAYEFYKKNPTDKVYMVDDTEYSGQVLFSFDGKKVFNFFTDYPHNLTDEQKKLFDSENPFWRNFYKK